MTTKTWDYGENVYAPDLNSNFAIKNLINPTVMGYTNINGTINAPIGTILPWLKTLTGTPVLPAGWAECDGAVGRPNLTGDIFLRGSSGVSGGTGGANSHAQNLSEIEQGGSSTSYLHHTSTDDNQPPFYTMVFIIKVGV